MTQSTRYWRPVLGLSKCDRAFLSNYWLYDYVVTYDYSIVITALNRTVPLTIASEEAVSYAMSQLVLVKGTYHMLPGPLQVGIFPPCS